MIARFRPSVARGSVDAPPSKTLAHRFLLAAALSESPSVVRGLCLSEDVLATIDCARSLGADLTADPNFTYNRRKGIKKFHNAKRIFTFF